MTDMSGEPENAPHSTFGKMLGSNRQGLSKHPGRESRRTQEVPQVRSINRSTMHRCSLFFHSRKLISTFGRGMALVVLQASQCGP
jgi:hypothetical protein